jgi:4-amino-4-deoxy-L-arabinose transferase-like glycosyltransferase
VNVHPGEVLQGDAHPEWALRLPNALLAIVALYVLYRGVARAFGRRAGLLGGLVLATSAHWFLLARQSITDMAYVAPMCAAMGLLLLGLHTSETETAKVHEVRIGSRLIGLSAWHLVFGAILLCALPQSLYLLSRNVELVLGGAGPHGFRFHWDEFASGSGGGNCHLAGQPACGVVTPVHHFEPFAQALLWLSGTFALVWTNRSEDRLRRLYILGGWFFAAIATLAKGPAGLGLPVLCGLACIAASRNWKALLDTEAVSGLLIVLVVALPWYIAAFVRHGTAFSDELIFNDMINRAFSHVHDTNEGADTSLVYYVSQLGWGLFPWVGLVPLGIAGWLRGRGEGAQVKEDAGSVLLAVWLFLAFTLFTMMGTKFHHYIFPAVPPAAMLLGVALDRAFGPLLDRSRKVIAPPNADDEHFGRMVGASVVGGAALLALVGHDLARHVAGESDGAIHFIELASYQYKRTWPVMLDFHGVLTAFTAVGCVLLLVAGARKARFVALGGFFGLAALFAVWCGDVYFTQVARHWGQGDVMRAYYAHRTGDAEPLAAYLMNWKGENFYSGNKLSLFVSGGAPLTQWVKDEKAKGTKVAFFVTEWTRIGGLKREVTAHAWSEVTRKEDSHQFVLMRAEF